MTALYLIGVFASMAILLVCKRFTSSSEQDHFLLEVPSMKIPDWQGAIRKSFQKTTSFILKAGTSIVVVSMILWSATHLPISSEGNKYDLHSSYAAKVGKKLEPIMQPLGLDWRAGVALFIGFAAREVVVSSMVMMYGIDDEKDESLSLFEQMKEVSIEGSQKKVFTTSSCLGLLIFYVFALQCFPTMAASRLESGSWKLPFLQLFLFTGVGYCIAVSVVNLLKTLGIE